jgi:hypothetical protein
MRGRKRDHAAYPLLICHPERSELLRSVEATTESKDPYVLSGVEVLENLTLNFAERKSPEGDDRQGDRGPSTPAIHSQANGWPAVRMTTRWGGT